MLFLRVSQELTEMQIYINEKELMKEPSIVQIKNCFMKVFPHDKVVQGWLDHFLMETTTVQQKNMVIVIKDPVHAFVMLAIEE
jgi:hypothetical protein